VSPLASLPVERADRLELGRAHALRGWERRARWVMLVETVAGISARRWDAMQCNECSALYGGGSRVETRNVGVVQMKRLCRGQVVCGVEVTTDDQNGAVVQGVVRRPLRPTLLTAPIRSDNASDSRYPRRRRLASSRDGINREQQHNMHNNPPARCLPLGTTRKDRSGARRKKTAQRGQMFSNPPRIRK
jgi:hypothetical protein